MNEEFIIKKANEYEEQLSYCGLFDKIFYYGSMRDYGELSRFIAPYIEEAFIEGYKQGKDNKK